MNLPYGKSCVDKLYMLRQEGFVPDHDFQNVLTEEILTQFHKDVSYLLFSLTWEYASSKNRRRFTIEPSSMPSIVDSMSTGRIFSCKAKSFPGIHLKRV